MDSIAIGLGWDPEEDDNVDIDASCIMLSKGRSSSPEIVYFGHKTSSDKSVKHSGDNLDGEGEGDDEQINIKVILIYYSFSSCSM